MLSVVPLHARTSVAVGRILGSVTIMFGVMILALPVSILTQNFTEHDDQNYDELVQESIDNAQIREDEHVNGIKVDKLDRTLSTYA